MCLVRLVWCIWVCCVYSYVVSEVVKLLFSVCRNVVRLEFVVILCLFRFDSRICSIGMKNSVMLMFMISCMLVMCMQFICRLKFECRKLVIDSMMKVMVVSICMLKCDVYLFMNGVMMIGRMLIGVVVRFVQIVVQFMLCCSYCGISSVMLKNVVQVIIIVSVLVWKLWCWNSFRLMIGFLLVSFQIRNIVSVIIVMQVSIMIFIDENQFLLLFRLSISCSVLILIISVIRLMQFIFGFLICFGCFFSWLFIISVVKMFSGMLIRKIYFQLQLLVIQLLRIGLQIGVIIVIIVSSVNVCLCFLCGQIEISSDCVIGYIGLVMKFCSVCDIISMFMFCVRLYNSEVMMKVRVVQMNSLCLLKWWLIQLVSGSVMVVLIVNEVMIQVVCCELVLRLLVMVGSEMLVMVVLSICMNDVIVRFMVYRVMLGGRNLEVVVGVVGVFGVLGVVGVCVDMVILVYFCLLLWQVVLDDCVDYFVGIMQLFGIYVGVEYCVFGWGVWQYFVFLVVQVYFGFY